MDKESELSANHPVVAAAAALVPLIEASRNRAPDVAVFFSSSVYHTT